MRDRDRDREREQDKGRTKERKIATGIQTEREREREFSVRGHPFFSLEDAENDPKGQPFHRPWQREDGTRLHLSYPSPLSSLLFVSL